MNKLSIFIIVVIAVWAIGVLAEIYLLPNVIYNGLDKLIVQKGVNPSGVPVNTLYTLPTLSSPSYNSFLVNTGANRDTLYTVGVLDLSEGPQILHVPSISGRYYSIDLVGSRGDDFAVIGSTTSDQAGNYLISGPKWQGELPGNMTQIISPDNKIILIARVLVKNESELQIVYNLSKQIQLSPLGS
jgi:hypothetical protein